MNPIIVVGAGFSGSIIARKLAEDRGCMVTVVERRSHVGGNAYDEMDEHGILIQKYGPHFLNTNHYEVIRFLSRYATLHPHFTKLLSFIDGRYLRLPFNFLTVQQLVGAENSEALLEKLRNEFKGCDRVPILELVNHGDQDISAYGNLLFEKAYRTYTSKMWGIEPEKIDPYVLKRVPMAMNYDERYLNKDFQYLPTEGFTKLFTKILEHPNIEVRLNTDALPRLQMDRERGRILYEGAPVACLIYTGAIDELFKKQYGVLPYRSLEIRYEYFPDSESILPSEIVSYPQAIGYTRKTEYRKLMLSSDGAKGTVIATEYPLTYDPNAEKGNIPYYPVMTRESSAVYQRYLEEAQRFPNLFLCGRLAEFKYFNMDICIEHALEYVQNIYQYLETQA